MSYEERQHMKKMRCDGIAYVPQGKPKPQSKPRKKKRAAVVQYRTMWYQRMNLAVHTVDNLF